MLLKKRLARHNRVEIRQTSLLQIKQSVQQISLFRPLRMQKTLLPMETLNRHNRRQKKQEMLPVLHRAQITVVETSRIIAASLLDMVVQIILISTG